MAEEVDPYEVHWALTDASMKHYVRCSGVKLRSIYNDPNCAFLKVFNSKGELTPGWIKIPHDKLLELAQVFQRYHYEHNPND